MKRALEYEADCCSICLEPPKDPSFALPCGHNAFHSACLLQWFEASNTRRCPLCNAAVPRGKGMPPPSAAELHSFRTKYADLAALCAVKTRSPLQEVRFSYVVQILRLFDKYLRGSLFRDLATAVFFVFNCLVEAVKETPAPERHAAHVQCLQDTYTAFFDPARARPLTLWTRAAPSPRDPFRVFIQGIAKSIQKILPA